MQRRRSKSSENRAVEQGEEDLLFGAEVVVNGRARERGLFPDLQDGDVLEGHLLIQLRAGVDDLFAAGGGEGVRALPLPAVFAHGRLHHKLLRRISTISSCVSTL